jgi:serine/threonine-protein kinase
MLAAILVLVGGSAGGAYWYFEHGPGSLITVPQVAGETRKAAENALTGVGLEVRFSAEHSDTVAEGVVISSEPGAGARLKEGSIIQLVVSSGVRMVEIPAEGVVGVEADAAEQALAAAGLDGEFTRTAVWDTTVPEGVVISIKPEGGTEAPHDQAIELVVSRGPEPVDAPALTDMTLEDAQAAAAKWDLTVVKGGEDYSETVGEGLIISQDPAAATETHRGAEISVVVSLGMPFVEVPKVTSMTYDEAVAKLKEYGLVAQQVAPLGDMFHLVRDQDPAPGESVRKGSTVTLTVV